MTDDVPKKEYMTKYCVRCPFLTHTGGTKVFCPFHNCPYERKDGSFDVFRKGYTSSANRLQKD